MERIKANNKTNFQRLVLCEISMDFEYSTRLPLDSEHWHIFEFMRDSNRSVACLHWFYFYTKFKLDYSFYVCSRIQSTCRDNIYKSKTVHLPSFVVAILVAKIVAALIAGTFAIVDSCLPIQST